MSVSHLWALSSVRLGTPVSKEEFSSVPLRNAELNITINKLNMKIIYDVYEASAMLLQDSRLPATAGFEPTM